MDWHSGCPGRVGGEGVRGEERGAVGWREGRGGGVRNPVCTFMKIVESL